MRKRREHNRANLPSIPDGETYYVYGFFDRDALFYVGKGRGYRHTKHFSDYYLKENSPKNSKIKKINREGRKVNVIFFAIHLTQHEALLLEKSLIEYYGVWDEGGQLTNLRHGSLDSAGMWTEDRKKLHSVRLRGKNSEVPLNLVKKAKCLSYYRGFTLKQISELPEFCEYRLAPGTIRSWCSGDKFSYVLPHLHHTRSTLREEKYSEVVNLKVDGFSAREISDILGLKRGLIDLYLSHYNKLSKEL